MRTRVANPMSNPKPQISGGNTEAALHEHWRRIIIRIAISTILIPTTLTITLAITSTSTATIAIIFCFTVTMTDFLEA